ncbi:MAG: iron dependent repressor, metal binding and dimerization domain protein, partial [Thermoplasmatota archaeon]
KGEELGREIVRKHRVLEVFLNRYFTISRTDIHEKACQMEHIFNMKMINEMCKNLGAPERCPHGKPIPPCEEVNCPVEGDDN